MNLAKKTQEELKELALERAQKATKENIKETIELIGQINLLMVDPADGFFVSGLVESLYIEGPIAEL